MKIVHYKEMDAAPVTIQDAEGVTIRWLIAAEDGAPGFAMRLFEIQPKGHTPLHVHDSEHEVFILSGEGVVWKEGEEVSVGPGTAIFVPSNEKHCFFNRREDVLRFLCMVPV